MAANTTPIFVKSPRISSVTTGTSANANFDGTGTVATVFTADATNGSKIDKVILQHMGTNTGTVIRLFVNNGSANSTATNNALVYEVALASNTASQTAASSRVEVPMDLVLAPGYKLNCTTGTAIAAGVMVTAVGGDY
jgi:hypothetical protein